MQIATRQCGVLGFQRLVVYTVGVNERQSGVQTIAVDIQPLSLSQPCITQVARKGKKSLFQHKGPAKGIRGTDLMNPAGY